MIGNSLLQENIVDFGGWQKTIFFIVGAFLLAIIFYLISQPIVRGIRYIVRGLEKDVKDVPGVDLISGPIGLVVGLIVAFLLSQPILRLSVPLVGNAYQKFNAKAENKREIVKQAELQGQYKKKYEFMEKNFHELKLNKV